MRVSEIERKRGLPKRTRSSPFLFPHGGTFGIKATVVADRESSYRLHVSTISGVDQVRGRDYHACNSELV